MHGKDIRREKRRCDGMMGEISKRDLSSYLLNPDTFALRSVGLSHCTVTLLFCSDTHGKETVSAWKCTDCDSVSLSVSH